MSNVEVIGAERQPMPLLDAKGSPRKILHNAQEYLGHHPAWRGVVKWDEFSNRPLCFLRPPRDEARLGTQVWRPVEWADDHTTLAMSWLAAKGLDLSEGVVGMAAMMVGRWSWNRLNPPRAWLEDLRWDPACQYADDWLIRWAGAEDNTAVRSVCRMWLISSVARIMQPGCQVDHMLVLEGKQGLGKNQLVRALCHDPNWFSATPLQLKNKDGSQQIQGIQVYMLDEFDRLLQGYSASAIKDFITQIDDRFRIPYGRQPERFLRSCVFVGATNETSYLEDATGNRRYWPVRVGVNGPLQAAALRANHEQLWAHARELWRGKVLWWPTPGETLQLQAEQSDREVDDPWRAPVTAWLATQLPGRTLTTADVMRGALDIPPKDFTRRDAARVGSIMRSARWEDTRPRVNNPNRDRIWSKSE